jgi:hypothetical protein
LSVKQSFGQLRKHPSNPSQESSLPSTTLFFATFFNLIPSLLVASNFRGCAVMAITKEFPSIKATIQVNGVDLTEYKHPDSDKNADNQPTNIPRVVKHIEVTSGTAFAFRFVKDRQFKHFSHHIAIQVEYDGHGIELLHEDQQQHGKKWETVTRRVLTGGNKKDGFYSQ